MKSIKIEKLIWYFVLCLGVMLCLRELREPDLWWQLRTGEWMLENKAFTFKDVFSFTNAGVDWINVKWGYEVIIAELSKLFGPEGVMFLNMASITLILLFLKKNHALLKKGYNTKSLLTITLCSIVFLILHNARINGRPEMTTYTLTAVYLFIFSKYKLTGSKIIYLLIPLQVFWTNMHEAYGVGVVMIIIFVTGNLIEHFLTKKRNIAASKESLTPVFIVGILSIIGILINPNGAKLFDHYIEIYTQLQENKFTTENFSYKTKEYWNYAAVINLFLFALTFKSLFLFEKGKKLKVKLFSAIDKWGVVYLLLYLAFFYLSLQAVRNTFFFAIISLPILAIIIEEKLLRQIKEGKISKFIIAVCVLLYLAIGTGTFYKTVSPREQYGLKTSSRRTPLGAANFLKENKIKGKGFVDYLNSSYLLWSLQPDFKTYLDLRDLDIFPQKFMENVFVSYENPGIELEDGSTLWDVMVEADSFNYVVMSNNIQFANFNRHLLYNDPNYELVFADGVASVFLSTSKYPDLIDSLGYNNGDRDIFMNFTDVKTEGLAKVVTRIFWPFYKEKNVNDKEERLTRQAYYRMIN